MKNKALEFSNSFLNSYDENSPIENMWSDIKSHLSGIIENYVPSKTTSTRFNQPWINTELKRLSRRKKRRYNRAKNKPKTSKECQLYIRIKRESEKKCKTAYNKYMEDIITPENDRGNKRFWSYIKSQRKENSGVSALKDKNGTLQNDGKTKANILNEQFSDVFNKNEDQSTIPNKGHSKYPTMPNIQVDINGAKKLLQNLNPHKATGLDGIPTRLLKELSCELAPVYTFMFNASLNQGKILSDWKKANVIPVFKKGNKANPENYRPISLTCITCNFSSISYLVIL